MEVMTTIKKLLLDNWLPKLLCLLLAIGVWVVIRQHMNQDATPHSSDIRRSHP